MKTALASLAALLAFVPLALGSAAPRPGSLDPSFGRGGKVLTAVGNGDVRITGLVREPNGKVVAAVGVALVRYNPYGSLDRSFGAGGIAAVPHLWVYSVDLQPDGKLVAAGFSNGGTSSGLAVARYLPNGSLDPSFGTGGIATSVPGGASAIALQRDGKIVVSTSVNTDFALLRFQADGLPDESFGTNGMVTTDFGGLDGAGPVAVQADGRIVAGGTSCPLPSDDPCDTGDPGRSVLARYNPDGSLDPSFGSGGKVRLFQEGVGDQESVVDLAGYADGKILAAGLGSDGLVRLNRDGSLDRSFGRDGTVADGRAVAVRRNGNILVVHSYFELARLRSNGSLDPSFGSGGNVKTRFGPGFDNAWAILLEPHAKILVGGYHNSPDGMTYRLALARYFDGTLNCVVPNVKGKELAAARGMLSRAHCSLGEVKRVFSSTVKQGLVISQKPKARTRRPFGTKVKLVVSEGKRR